MSRLLGIRRAAIPKARNAVRRPIEGSPIDEHALDPDAPTPVPNIRTDIRDAIFAAWEDKRRAEQAPHRRYLGASDIGHECARHVWYVWRNVRRRDFPGRLLRLFDRGHREEPAIEADFDRIGMPISTAAVGGGQHAFTDETGHFRAHLDGIVREGDRRLVIEMKTMSKASFSKLADRGGVRYSHPHYYAQIMAQAQVAAGRGVGIDAALFFAVCKDNDDLWVEEVGIDAAVQDRVMNRVMAVVGGIAPPPLDCSPGAPPCRWCDFKAICRDHRFDLIERNCRTCDHAETVSGGGWRCRIGEPFGTPCDRWSQHRGL